MFAIFGNIAPPLNNGLFTAGSQGQGLFLFISNLLKITGIIGGIYMVFQFIFAGYMYLSAEGDVKKTTLAWAKIWQSILGFVIIASAFVLASLVERVTGIKILNPEINGP
jgi:hypothetical protein